MDSELPQKIEIRDMKKDTDPKYLIENIKTEDRHIIVDAYNEHTHKYSVCKLLKENFEQNYMTTMNQLCRFACHDAYRVIQRLYDHKFWYQNIEFSNLPIIYTVEQSNDVNPSLAKNLTVTMYGLWFEKGLSQSLIDFVKTETEIFVSDQAKPMFKIRVLPEILLKHKYKPDLEHAIDDDQEYNELALTAFRKCVKLNKNKESITYNSIRML